METDVRPIPSHFNSFGDNAEKDIVGYCAFYHNLIVIGGIEISMETQNHRLLISMYHYTSTQETWRSADIPIHSMPFIVAYGLNESTKTTISL